MQGGQPAQAAQPAGGVNPNALNDMMAKLMPAIMGGMGAPAAAPAPGFGSLVMPAAPVAGGGAGAMPNFTQAFNAGNAQMQQLATPPFPRPPVRNFNIPAVPPAPAPAAAKTQGGFRYPAHTWQGRRERDQTSGGGGGRGSGGRGHGGIN